MPLSSRLEEALFAAALALPRQERAGYLQRACGEDHALQAQLQALLASFEQAGQFIKESAPQFYQLEAGTQIDRYRLLEPLGEGGCGVVYRAEQLAPVRREVALKVIKLGMDTRAVIARFEAERQLLALMDHPHIAQVFDAGATANGRPYFVMELVRGIPITEYCDQSRLGVTERLALFVQVCQAIQHAHQQGVIHRDIKPSNVLLTLREGMPLVKVIDFGIAKATQGRLTDQSAFTALEQFVGTPAYVSPEQTEPGGLGVDAPSDIYSLGVLLYELLTGCTPFETHALLHTDLVSMKRRIREEAPPTPSKRLDALTSERLTTISQRYQSSELKLIKQLRGDLDWIVMRCLEKERERRYASAHDVAADLQRYLRHEPVSARPPSFLYTLGKFAHRHRLIVATAASIIAVLFIATLISTALALRARHAEQLALQAKQEAQQAEQLAQQERASAQAASLFMLELIGSADPFARAGKDFTARELLDKAARNLRDSPNQSPEMRARLLEAIGRAYRRQDQPARATAYLQDSLRIRQQAKLLDDAHMGSLLTELAIAFRNDGKLDDSDRAFRRALEISERSASTKTITHARLMADLGRMELNRGNLDIGESYMTRSLQLTRELKGPRDPEVADILTDLSNASTWRDDFDGAERIALEAASIYHESVAELHPDRVLADFQLGQVLYLKGRMREAATLFERTLTAQRLLFGNSSSRVADTLDSLARVRLAQHNFAEAERLTREAVDMNIRSRGQHHFSTGYLRSSLGETLLHQRRYVEAESELRAALDVFVKNLLPDHLYISSSEYWLGEALLGAGRYTDAEVMLTASVNRLKRTAGPAWRSARATGALGEILYRQGRFAEAEKYLLDGYRGVTTGPGADELARRTARDRLARFYAERGQPHKLDELLLAAANNREPQKTVGSD